MMNFSFYNLGFFFLFLLGISFWLLGLYFIKFDFLLLLDWEILTVNSGCFVMTFLLDWMSLIFMGSVSLISSMVVFYSGYYMSGDGNNYRFLLLVLMFVFSMFMMIISPNLVSILIGWDGLGLVSYCLVIYFQNLKSYNAGMLTVLTNRLGDVAILLSISWMLNFGSWHYIYYIFFWEDWMFYLILLLILAGFTKSAQIPFSSWLPAAMAAPTPVSALVHSSTLVTAGVYLLIRFSDLISNLNCSWFLYLSMMTMFMSGLGANFEYDLKKIIALSTLSQLGLMMSILFLGFPYLSFFHLLTHAFFKALLFLCAGLMIHSMNDSQDIRHMGGMVYYLPLTSTCFCISSLSLCGLPFLSGFYSKDMILEYYTMFGFNLFLYLVFFISVGLTVSYTFRLVYYCLSDGVGPYSCQLYFEDSGMIFSMIFLLFMSIMGGSLLMWLIFPVPGLILMPFSLSIMPLLFIVFGVILGYDLSVYSLGFKLYSLSYSYVFFFMGSMWFMPKFSTYMIYSPSLSLSKFLYENMDMGWGESMMSGYSLLFFSFLSKLNQVIQNNNVKIIMISFFLIIIIMNF
uniref:NADH-ubiquinone oxidoreductase chain 5 n=1 Tax=Ochterus marginatus TaxID=280162 RepID=C5HIV9_9HEMI|nr:NADH dehydrogenase subunit 5 [Ochterus marginatus]